MKLIVLLLCVASVAATISWDEIVPSDTEPEISAEEPKEESRITNGRVARPKQFPYQVGLAVHLQSASYWCGGTLISNQWVLTAAHCTDSILSADVYLGTVDRSNRYEQGRRVIHVERKHMIVHEHWNPSTYQNDIALIKLPYPIAFNEFIQPAKLPKLESNGNYQTYSNANTIASGWGRLGDSGTTASDLLQWILVPTLDNSECSDFFGSSVRETNICIDTQDYKSTCKGDSGGPLVLADDSYTIIGITSFGVKYGCQMGWPSVFTRVTSYLDWIARNAGIA